jgi:predicted GH43/DUF377 family glycosyl hydrolase
MQQLLEKHLEPVLACNPGGPEWQRGSVFNPSVLKIGDSWRMLFRATPTTDFGIPGTYTSRIGVADSNDGLHWTIRPEPVVVPTMPEEEGLGCEDPRATIVGNPGNDWQSAEVVIFYNAAELREGWTRPKGRVACATATEDFTQLEKHGVILATGTPDEIRIKAAALFPAPEADGAWPFVFTFGSESPYGTLLKVEDMDLAAIRRGITAEQTAQMFVNERSKYVLLAPPTPVERGPEVGSPPIKVGDEFVMFYCPANQ